MTISDAIMPMSLDLYQLAKDEEAPLYQPPENTWMLACCRHGYAKVADHLANSTRRVLLPGYTCVTCVTPFTQRGWTPGFYGVDHNFRMEEDQFLAALEVTKPDVVVAQRLYGMEFTQRERELFAYAKEKGCFLLEDITHSLFTEPDDLFDVSCGSAMKWFPIPDGAVYRSKVLPIEDHAELEEHTEYVKGKLDMQYVRHIAYQIDDRRLYSIAAHMLRDVTKFNRQGNIVVRRMSDASSRILAQEDLAANNAARLRNAKVLWDGLKDNPLCEMAYRELSDAVTGPLWFPTYLKKGVDRKEFRKEHLLPHVQAVGLWPLEVPGSVITETVRDIYDRIMVFPISQNYTEKDMEFVVELMDKAAKAMGLK